MMPPVLLANRPLFHLAVAALAVVSGCQGCLGCQTSPVDAPGSSLPVTCQAEAPLIEAQKLDILFVVDNSNSMRDKQIAVADQLTAFVDELQKTGGVRQDFHVGVITTSVYLHSSQNGLVWFKDYPTQSGRLRPVPLVFDDGGVDLENPAGERVLQGDDAQLVTKFSLLVRQGVAGSGQETPFEATRLALLTELATTPLAQGGNGGFLRDGARLLVVVVSDEDDCSEEARPSVVTVSDDPLVADCTEHAASLTTVGEYYRLFSQGLKNADGTAKELIWGAIAPVGLTSNQAQEIVADGHVQNVDCPDSFQGGYRHRAMAEHFDPSLANLDSICRSSYHDTLVRIASLAAVSQTLSVRNLPDPSMLQVSITRADGTPQTCTISNHGITTFTAATDGGASQLTFGNTCKRRADDQGITFKLLCAT
jgi:hypothetical protein